MRKIDKTKIISTRYHTWLGKVNAKGAIHNKNYTYYYDDVVMNLYNCQEGVCAYTEMHICIPELYKSDNWINGKYKLPATGIKRNDHFGELDHYDPSDKTEHYWNWDNLFMIHAKVNSIKTNNPIVPYLKPDLPAYSAEKYFDYDVETHRFIPNTDIDDNNIVKEIQEMIDDVLCLNHGVVRNERRDFINNLLSKRERGEPLVIDRFFTSVTWVLAE
jgi:hypothetical protein